MGYYHIRLDPDSQKICTIILECYVQLSREEALLATDLLETDILAWLKKYKHRIEDMPCKYIKERMKSVSASPFGQFYILYKIHKGIGDDGQWPTRPVCCSDVSSLARMALTNR
jgi:hypothetical protein